MITDLYFFYSRKIVYLDGFVTNLFVTAGYLLLGCAILIDVNEEFLNFNKEKYSPVIKLPTKMQILQYSVN
jgi:hypothetical protein